MSRKQEPWEPPKKNIVIYGSVEQNPPPVDLRPKIRELLKRLDAVLAALEILPAERSATARDRELNAATWWAWRNAVENLFLLSEILKVEFLYQPETIYENTVLSAASNQAINWLATYAPKIVDWMKAKEVRQRRTLPPFPQQFHEGLERVHHRLLAECVDKKSQEAGAPLPSKHEGPPALWSDSEAFADFSAKQRKLLNALFGKSFLAIPAVKKAVYGTNHIATKTLEQLMARANRRLAESNLRLEIKRKSNALRLQPV